MVIDGPERRHPRPVEETAQRTQYSGKKTHTDKNVIIVNSHSRKVVHLSQTAPGKTHDKKIADAATLAYPVNATLGKDPGFQGYEPPGVLTWQPRKKPSGHALPVSDYLVNRLLSSLRSVVEHAFSGVNRCRIVKDVFRNTTQAVPMLSWRLPAPYTICAFIVVSLSRLSVSWTG